MEKDSREKAQRGRIWKVMGNEEFIRGMWELRKILADASREKQEGAQGQWQEKSPSKRFWSRSKEMRIWTVAPN